MWSASYCCTIPNVRQMAQQLFVKFFNKKLREDPFNCYRAVTSLRTMWLKYVISWTHHLLAYSGFDTAVSFRTDSWVSLPVCIAKQCKLLCVTLSAVVGTSVDIQSVDTAYHTQDLRVLLLCWEALKSSWMWQCFWLFAVPIVLEDLWSK